MEMKEDSVVLITELHFLSLTVKGRSECLDVVWPEADECTL